jgi:hypothetical protein
MSDRLTLADIKAKNEAAGRYFFSRDTMKFFGDTMRNFAVRHIGGRVFVERVRAPGNAPDRATGEAMVGALREFDPATGEIGTELRGDALADVERLRELRKRGFRGPSVVRNGWTVVTSPNGWESGKMRDAARAWAVALERRPRAHEYDKFCRARRPDG